MKNMIIPAFNVIFGLSLAILPPLISKGKYPLLTVLSLFLGLLFIAGAILLLLHNRMARLVNRLAALSAITMGLVLMMLLIWSGTYVNGIFGALGVVISGTLFMTVVAVANLFLLYPGILLFSFRNRDPQGKSLSS